MYLSYRCTSRTDPLWSTGTHWTHQRYPQVTSAYTLIPVFIYVRSAYPLSSVTDKAIFARGIAAVRDKYICVGKWPKRWLLIERILCSLSITDFNKKTTLVFCPCQGSLLGQCWCLMFLVKEATSHCLKSWRNTQRLSRTWRRSAQAVR